MKMPFRPHSFKALNHIKRTVTCCVLIVTTCSTVSAQQKAPLRFEVASIKLNKSGAGGGNGSCHGADDVTRPNALVPLGHCLFHNVSVRYLFSVAYAAEVVDGDRPGPGEVLRIAGLPSWGTSDRFDVDAKADDLTATRAQLQEMLRYLLAERFGLQFHRVTKEVPGYRLVVSKDGPKLSQASPDEPFRYTGRPQELIVQNSPLADLQGFLSVRLGSPVTNATNLTGRYSFTLRFSPINGNAADSDPSAGPSVFTALQEQLGLKLEKTRLPIVSYVVDSIQRPNVN
jgi:uncharacterized protein (TIGR03435 family)